MHTKPKIIPIGIIGGGFGALVTYAVLRFRGIAAADIHVFSPDQNPADSWLRYAQTINQTKMRSESIGHFYPTDSPGLATVEAMTKRSLLPILKQWFDRYQPSITFFLNHARQMAEQVGFWQSQQRCRIANVVRQEDGTLLLYDAEGNSCGRVRNLILAVGHGPVNQPDFLQRFRREYPEDGRIKHAFEKKEYQPNRAYVVVGNGHTAATEWATILNSGGTVVSISRNSFTVGQSLNTPRQYFSKRGLSRYTQRSTADRRRELLWATQGTIPGYDWRRHFARAQREGRLHLLIGDITQVEAQPEQLNVTVQTRQEQSIQLHADRIICATGFQSAGTSGLLSHIISDFKLAVDPETGHIITDDTLRLADNIYAVGPAAVWTLPNADSLGGMKIAARRIAKQLAEPEKPIRQIRNWWQLITHQQLS